MILSETVASGDLRASLEALRDQVAAEIENGVVCVKCHGSVSSPTAALAKQLTDLLVRIDALPKAKEGSKLDDLAKRRAARRGTPVPDGTTRKVERGAGSGGAGGKRRAVPGPVAGGRARGRATGTT